MKINIPKVIVAVPMAEYAPELAGSFLHVWVNPPREKLQQYDRLVTEMQEKELAKAREVLDPVPGVRSQVPGGGENGHKGPLALAFEQAKRWLHVRKDLGPDEGIDEGLLRWYAEIWSQGPEDARWTLEELRTLEAQDPTFLSWMIAETWKARSEHMQQKKKA